MSDVMLSVENLTVRYGDILAVKGVSFEVRAGEIFTLIGANGAGKTSTLRALSGMVRYDGAVRLNGRELGGLPAEDIVAAGLAHVPEGRRVFGPLTVVENLRLGAWTRRRERAAVAADMERMLTLFPRLHERRDQPAGTLSGGEQQMLAVARILRTGARLLLLDEISEGLAPVIVQKLAEVVRTLRQQGYTIVMVEQNFRFAAPLADRFLVMEHGRIIQSFTQAELPERMHDLHEYLGV